MNGIHLKPNQKLDWPNFLQQRQEVETEFEMGPSDGESRYDLLLKLARLEYLTGDLKLAREHYLEVAKTCNNHDLKAQSKLGLAEVVFVWRDWEVCGELISEGLDLAPSKEIKAGLLTMRGQLAYRRGELKSSIGNYEVSLRLEPISEARINTLSAMGVTKHDLKLEEEAFQYLDDALNLAYELHYPDLIVRILNNIGTHHYSVGSLEKAKVTFEEAIAIGERIHCNIYICFTYLNLAGTYLKLGQRDDGMEMLLKAKDLFENLGDEMMLGATNIELGHSFRLQHEYRRAMSHLLKGLELGQKCGSLRYTLFAYREMGLLHMDQHEWNRAITDLEIAMAFANTLGNKAHLSDVERALSTCRAQRDGIFSK